MKYFVDTNVLIDLITIREPFGTNAVKLFEKAKSENWKFYTSAISISTTYYIASRTEGTENAKNIINGLLGFIEIIPADRLVLKTAVSSKINDYEDAIQFQCALRISDMNGIITRDLKGFKHSTIPVFAPEEVLF